MIMWAFPVLGCALPASALLLRRRPLTALAVLLSGSAASMALNPPVPAAVISRADRGSPVAAGLEICYIAATRIRRVSVTGAGHGLALPC